VGFLVVVLVVMFMLLDYRKVEKELIIHQIQENLFVSLVFPHKGPLYPTSKKPFTKKAGGKLK
jgi:hypothetical protein